MQRVPPEEACAKLHSGGVGDNAPSTIPGAALLPGARMEKAFNSFLCRCFHSRTLRERWVCTKRVCYRALRLVSAGSYCRSDPAAAAASFEAGRAALPLARCCLPGGACCRQRHPGEEGLPGKTVRSCVGAPTFFSAGLQGEDWQPLLAALPFPAPATAEHWAECGNSACMTWELWLVLQLSDFIVRTLFSRG